MHQNETEFVVSSAPVQKNAVEQEVRISDVKPQEFHHAVPLAKLHHERVVMGRHSSVSSPKSPLVADEAVSAATEIAPSSTAEIAAPVDPAPVFVAPVADNNVPVAVVVVAPVSEVVSAAAPAPSKGKEEDVESVKPVAHAPVATAAVVPKLNFPVAHQSSTVEMTDFLKSDPVKVREQYHPRSDAVSVRARANAKLTPIDIKNLQANSVKCHACNLSFDIFRSPDKCSECKNLVCTKCSCNLPYLEALIAQDSCVCTDCWSVVRSKLLVKQTSATTSASDSALAKAEIEGGDKSMALEPEERANPAERQLIAAVVKASPNLNKEQVRAAAIASTKALKCPCCDRGFDLFRRPCVCGKCRKIVCAGAACVRVVNEVVEGAAFACCRNCWGEVRVALVDKQKHKPELFNAIEVDKSVGDRFMVEAQPGKSLHLEQAKKQIQKLGQKN